MGQVNSKSISLKISNSNAFQKRAEKIMEKRFEKAKDMFIKDFEKHPVSQEISDGPTASNSTNTLGGIGNLFSYIGFDAGAKPIDDLKDLLESKFSYKQKGTKTKGNKPIVLFQVSYPDLKDVKDETPMPWENGRSWVAGIERGISGFSNYMYKRFVEGRSKEALQADKKVRSGSFKSVKYLSDIASKFKNNITS
jgi:hypothetical protein